jgi:DNA (cytosine-5)-methyltransferase 1
MNPIASNSSAPTFLSVCSGIEAASVAWNPLGWRAVGFAEIEKFPCDVLAHHYPNVKNYGDLTDYQNWPEDITGDGSTLSVLVGGPPCQAFSLAGLRGGLSDPRGNLSLTYLGVVERYRPRVVVYENVPGILSATSHEAPDPSPPPPPVDLECDGAEVESEDVYDGEEDHAFSCLLAGFSELGYEWGFRVLDAQYFGVPQRRRRVFVVASPRGSGIDPSTVLFEPDCLRGDLTPSRETGEGVAGDAGSGVAECSRTGSSGGGYGIDYEHNSHRLNDVTGPLLKGSSSGGGHPLPAVTFCSEVATVDAKNNVDRGDSQHLDRLVAHSLSDRKRSANAVAFRTTGNDGCYETGDQVGALQTGTDQNQNVVAFAENSRAELRLENGDGSRTGTLSTGGGKPGQGTPMIAVGGTAPAVTTGAPFSKTGNSRVETEALVAESFSVRRLTPRECERLQGFPDDYTLIPGDHHRPRKRRDYLETVRYLMVTMGLSKGEAQRIANHPDGPRYKALGNSMPVLVMAWLGVRIVLAQRHGDTKNSASQ